MGTLGLSPEAKAKREAAKRAAIPVAPPVIEVVQEEPPKKKKKRSRRGKGTPPPPPKPKVKKPKIKQIARPPKKFVLETFQKFFPKLFNEESPLPLKIGILDDIKSANIGLTVGTIKLFLKNWTARREYHVAMIQDDASRYSLDGEIVCPVSIRERDFAISKLSVDVV